MAYSPQSFGSRTPHSGRAERNHKSMVSACTIVACNYLAHARVLAASFAEHHPDADFTVLLIDDEDGTLEDGRERFPVLRLRDIGLDGDEVRRLAAIYTVTELATAVKPRFLRHLLSLGRRHVIYLDPDIRIYGPLQDAAALAERHGIVLTPHITEPMPEDERQVDDFTILAAGVYNLGFIALGPGAEPFLDWWWARTRRQALVAPGRMMFTDQRWVDFAPSCFDHVILKDRAVNVAYWNLHARDLTWNGGRYQVDGVPLKFFHFSGFDARTPHLLSRHQGVRPRVLLSERPTVARICEEYAAALAAAGLEEVSARPYGWDAMSSGIRVDPRMRRLYWEAMREHEAGRAPEPPNPFMDGDAFLQWLAAPAAAWPRDGLSRYLSALYDERLDVRMEFRHVPGCDRERYLEWVRTLGCREEQIPAALLPPLPEAARDAESRTAALPQSGGVNVAGYLGAELGIGEAARLISIAVDAAGIPQSTLTYDRTLSRKTDAFVDRGPGGVPYDVTILCVNADQTPVFARDAGRDFLRNRHTVGYWFWELERLPEGMHGAFECVDEVWCASRFVSRAVEAAGRKPVHTIPLPVPIPPSATTPARRPPEWAGRFAFLFMFDFFSVLERKNPIGLIEAFRRAFPRDGGPVLVIKTINGESRLTDLERLRAAAAGSPDIVIIDEHYPAQAKLALLRSCDCYVSLHRSEGFGLTMAEAMALGKPVIATAYSGNLDFMTPENAFLVDYVLTRVPAGCHPYPEGDRWADPDLDSAAACMRRVYEAPDEGLRRGRRAREDVLAKHGLEVTAAHVRRRIDAIRERRTVVPVVGRPWLVDRRERERLEADHRYNDALTAVDRAIPRLRQPLPHPPAFDEQNLPRLNELWHIVPPAPPARGRGIRARLARLVWRMIEPSLARQQAFNSVLVDHLNRNTPTERALRDHAVRSEEAAVESAAILAGFHSQLVQYLQQISLYVDAQDRAVAAGLQNAIDALASATTGGGHRRAELLHVLATVEARIAGLQRAAAEDRATRRQAAASTGAVGSSEGRPASGADVPSRINH